jgi:hypothetical protein
MPDNMIPIRSVAISRILLVISLLLSGFVLFITVRYYLALSSNDVKQFIDFLNFKKGLLGLIPFVLIIYPFFIGIWIYSLYVDFNNHFEYFDYSPMKAMYRAIVPVVNLFGIGLAFSRIINYMDRYASNESYVKKTFRIKVGLSFFYAGLFGLLFALLLNKTLPESIELFDRSEIILFNFTELFLVLFSMTGIYILIPAFNGLVKQNPNSGE